MVIGFAAETENIISYASKKLRAKAADLIIANDAAHALGSEDNDAVFVTERLLSRYTRRVCRYDT